MVRIVEKGCRGGVGRAGMGCPRNLSQAILPTTLSGLENLRPSPSPMRLCFTAAEALPYFGSAPLCPREFKRESSPDRRSLGEYVCKRCRKTSQKFHHCDLCSFLFLVTFVSRGILSTTRTYEMETLEICRTLRGDQRLIIAIKDKQQACKSSRPGSHRSWIINREMFEEAFPSNGQVVPLGRR